MGEYFTVFKRTTNWFFFSLFSYLLKKGAKKKEEKVKLALNLVFKICQYLYTLASKTHSVTHSHMTLQSVISMNYLYKLYNSHYFWRIHGRFRPCLWT